MDSQRIARYYLPAALAAAFLVTLVVLLPRILDPFAIERDYRNVAEFYPAGFESWFLGDGRIFTLSSPLYSLLLTGARVVMSPVLFAKLLVFPLLLTSVYFVFRLGRYWANPGTALAMGIAFAVFNLAADTEVSVVAGLHRSFSVPLLLALLVALREQRYTVAALVIVLAGLIYLPLLPVLSLTYLLALFRRDATGKWRLQLRRQTIALLAIALLLVVVVASPVLFPRLQDAVASGLTAWQGGEHMLEDPHYQAGGRLPLFVIFPIFGRAGLASSPSTAIQLIVLGLLAAGIIAVRGRRGILLPSLLRRLLLASGLSWILAWLAILLTSSTLLYLPSRHTESPLFLILLLIVFLNVEGAFNSLSTRMVRQPPRLLRFAPLILLPLVAGAVAGEAVGVWAAMRWLLVICVLLLALLLVARRRTVQQTTLPPRAQQPRWHWVILGVVLLLLSPIYILATGVEFESPTVEERALYGFLQTLPADVTIAGDPCALDGVPYYAHRDIFYSCWRFQEASVLPGLRAYYAEDATEVADFCHDYDIDYLVVNTNTFSPEALARERYFFSPFSEQLAPELKEREQFYLPELAKTASLFQTGKYSVVTCPTTP